MLLIGMIGIFLISGCSKYYPSEVRITNQAYERVLVDISKDNTQVNISIQEKPRELIQYQLKDQLIRVYCLNDIYEGKLLNHSILWSYQTEKIVRGNLVYSYPKVEFTRLPSILYFNESDYLNCYFKGIIEVRRLNFVDSILISNDTDYIRFYDIFGRDEFRIDCVDYNLKLKDKCEVIANYELKNFVESPQAMSYYVFRYISELQ